MIACLAVGVGNTIIALLSGAKAAPALLGFIFYVTFSALIFFALKNKAVHTMQDGAIQLADSPCKFFLILFIYIAGTTVGILAPWVLLLE